MTLLAAWVVFPLVLTALSLGCGVLVERIAGARLPGALLLPVGLAALIVIAQLATGTDTTAELAVPLVVVAALAGLVLAFRSRRELFPPWRRNPVDPWAAGAAAGVFVVFAAPVVFSGHATIAGYLKLEDTATWLAITDHVMEHGRNLEPLAPSSYEAILSNFLPHGYPYGSFLPMGVGHGVLGTDVAWLLQPHMAFLAAMLALSLYALTSSLVPSPALRAAVVAVASQAALLLGYSLWGGIKEVAGAFLLALLGALAAVVLRERGGLRTLVPLAVAAAATLAALSYGGAVWIGAVLAPVLVVFVRELGAVRALQLAGAFVGMLVVLSIPSIATGVDFLDYSPGGFTAESELGALVEPLSAIQVFGIWPSGDFRLRPDSMGLTRVLFVIVLLSGLGGLVWAYLRRAWGVLIYVGAAAFITVLLAAQGAPWVDAKTFANTTPAFLLAGMLGAAALVPTGRRIEAGIVAVAIAFGVVWSNTLQYREVDLAPHAQLQELQDISDRIGGEGPTLMNEYMPLAVRHFLREADPEGASLLRRRLVPVLNGRGLTEAEPYADIDRFRTAGVLDYRTLVLRRSAAASRPPSPYKLVWEQRYYEVWQRPAGPPPRSIAARLPLGGAFQAAAEPRCRDVLKLARQAGSGGTLAAAERQPAGVLALARTAYTPGWLADPGNPALIFPRGEGSLTGRLQVGRPGTYGVWLGGSFRGRMEVRVDGRLVKADRHQLNHPEQYVPLGTVTLQPGLRTVQLSYGGPDLHPGSAGNSIATAGSPPDVPFPIGPLALGPPAADTRVVRLEARRARELCGRSLDWVEALRGG